VETGISTNQIGVDRIVNDTHQMNYFVQRNNHVVADVHCLQSGRVFAPSGAGKSRPEPHPVQTGFSSPGPVNEI
jgi:hypothetical protein